MQLRRSKLEVDPFFPFRPSILVARLRTSKPTQSQGFLDQSTSRDHSTIFKMSENKAADLLPIVSLAFLFFVGLGMGASTTLDDFRKAFRTPKAVATF